MSGLQRGRRRIIQRSDIHTGVRPLPIEEGVMKYKTVEWFAKQMDRQLWGNRNKGGWRGNKCDFDFLIDKLEEEFRELNAHFTSTCSTCERDIFEGRPVSHHGGPEGASIMRKEIIAECADIANFAMMIADKINRREV